MSGQCRRLSDQGLFDFIGLYAPRAGPHMRNFTINLGTNPLEIGMKRTFGCTGHLETDATLFLGKTAIGYRITRRRTFSTNMTTLLHNNRSCSLVTV